MRKRSDALAATAAISNGMVWFGIAISLGGFAVAAAPAAFAGQWYQAAGWILLLLGALTFAAIGFVEQATMRTARRKRRSAS